MTSRVSLGGTTRSKRVFSIFIILFVLLILGTVEFAQSADFELEIDEAKWESSDGELVLKGFSGPRDLVSLANADSGATLAEVRTDREGKFEHIEEGAVSKHNRLVEHLVILQNSEAAMYQPDPCFDLFRCIVSYGFHHSAGGNACPF